MRFVPLLLLLSGTSVALLPACHPSKAATAAQQGQIKIGMASKDVRAMIGEPGLWVGKDGVELIFYVEDEDTNRAVSVAFVDSKVIAFDDHDTWPKETAEASEQAARKKRVTRGSVRVGMTEAALRASMGKPDGVTAHDGVETFHYVSSDEVDSVVDLRAGKVIGYEDVKINEFTQNVPHKHRTKSTTNGELRVGMDAAQVSALRGAPSAVKQEGDVLVHRYTDGDLLYSVGFRDNKVVAFWQYDLELEEEEREKREDEAKEREKAQRKAEQKARGGSNWGAVFNIVSAAAVQSASAALREQQRQQQQRPQPVTPTGAGGGQPSLPELDSCECPKLSCSSNGLMAIQGCRARCGGSRPVCQCVSCPAPGASLPQHSCTCN